MSNQAQEKARQELASKTVEDLRRREAAKIEYYVDSQGWVHRRHEDAVNANQAHDPPRGRPSWA